MLLPLIRESFCVNDVNEIPQENNQTRKWELGVIFNRLKLQKCMC